MIALSRGDNEDITVGQSHGAVNVGVVRFAPGSEKTHFYGDTNTKVRKTLKVELDEIKMS